MRYDAAGAGERSVALLEGAEREIVGTVRVQEVDDRERELVLRDVTADSPDVRSLDVDRNRLPTPRQEYAGGILATVARYPEIPVGARVSLSCEIEVPEAFDGFAYDRFV